MFSIPPNSILRAHEYLMEIPKHINGTTRTNTSSHHKMDCDTSTLSNPEAHRIYALCYTHRRSGHELGIAQEAQRQNLFRRALLPNGPEHHLLTVPRSGQPEREQCALSNNHAANPSTISGAAYVFMTECKQINTGHWEINRHRKEKYHAMSNARISNR